MFLKFYQCLKTQKILGKCFTSQIKSPKNIFLEPHPHVTNVGYYKYFLCYKEDSFHNDSIESVLYHHDGSPPVEGTPEEIRKLFIRKIYAAKRLKEGKVPLSLVKKEWKQFKDMLEEAGTLHPDLRYYLRGINYYDTYEELQEDFKNAVQKLLDRDNKEYYQEKLPRLLKWEKEIRSARQQRLWPFEYERLKRAPFEVVDYDFEKRGYDLHLIVKELIETKNLSKEEAKIEALKAMRFSDIDIVQRDIKEFKDDFETLRKFRKLFDIEKISKQMKDAVSASENLLKQLETVKTKEETVAIQNKIFSLFNSILKEPYHELLRRKDLTYFDNPYDLDYYHYRYVFRLWDYSSQDRFGIYKYFFSGKNVYPFTKLVMSILVPSFIFFAVMFTKRVKEFEKEHDVLVGNRSRYAFSTEEKFKGHH